MNVDEPITPLGTLDDTSDAGLNGGWARQDQGPALRAGDLVDRYEVEAVLGQGGAATVYRVRHQTLGVVRALKVLRFPRADLAERFLAEGQLQARLEHPNLVRVYDALMVGGLPALLLELIEGPTLAQHIADESIGLEEAERLFRAVVAGVARAHQEGVVHRDLKPANVLLSAQDGVLVPRVADFGIARVLEGLGDGWTQTGGLLGTPAYMAPEQVRSARDVDERADMFSLGVILYELCSGERPFAGSDMLSLLNAVDKADYQPIKEAVPSVPRHLQAAIEGCLRADPAQRIPDCQTLLSVLDGQPWDVPSSPADDQGQGVWQASTHAPPAALSRVMLALLVLSLAGLVWFVWQNHRQDAALEALQGEKAALSEARDAQVERAFGHRLYGEAWRRAQERPAEALALLRGAVSLLPDDVFEGEPILQHESLWKLARRGGTSSVLTREDVEWSAAAVTPDGQTLLAGNDHGEVVAWDRETGQERFRVLYYEGVMIGRLTVLSDPPLLIVQPDELDSEHIKDIAVRAYSLVDGRQVHEFADEASLHALHLTKDLKLGATNSGNEVLNIWKLASGQPTGHLNFPSSLAPRCFGISDDGRYAAAAYRIKNDGKVGWVFTRLRVVSVAGGETVLDGPWGDNACLMNFVGDALFVQSHTAGTARIDLRSGERTIVAAEPVFSQVYSSQERFLVNNFRSGDPVLRRVPDMMLLARLGGEGGRVYHAAFSPDERWLVTSHTDKRVRLWGTASGELLQTLHGHTSWVLASAVSSRGDLLTASKDGTVRLWHNVIPDNAALSVLDKEPGVKVSQSTAEGWLATLKGREVTLRGLDGQGDVSLKPPLEAPRGVVLSPSGRYLAVHSLDEGLVAIWDRQAPAQWRTWKMNVSMTRFKFSQQEDALLGVRGKYFGYHKLADGTSKERRVTHPIRQIKVVNREIFLSTSGGTLAAVKMEPEADMRFLEVRGKDLGALAVTLDGARAATADWDGEISLWDSGSQKLVRRWQGHQDGIPELRFTRDGKRLLSRAWDETVKVWDVATGRLLVTLKGHDNSVNCMRPSPDGTMLATGGRDATVRIWDLATGRLLSLEETFDEVLFLTWDEHNRVRARTAGRQLWTWALGPQMPASPGLASTGALTNLRVCRDTAEVVEMLPFPSHESVWAPPKLCAKPPIP